MNTIWIDITDLNSWRGHFTGIQRVVFNYAFRLQKDADNVKYFYYDPKIRKFYEKDIDLLKWQKENSLKSQNSNGSISIKNKLLNIVPPSVIRHTPKTIKINVKKVGKYILVKRADLKNNSRSRQQNFKIANFKPNDKVLVLGNGWDNQNIILDLGILKSKINFKLINIVYDLIPIFEPQYFGGLVTAQYTNYMFEAVTNCDLLLPISKSTKNDIFRFCDFIDAPYPETKVIRLGDEVSDVQPIKPKWLYESDYILCVGTIEIRKNHALLYYAYKKLLNEGFIPPKLIIVGKYGWYTKDIIMLFEQDTTVRNHIQIVQNTSDDELSWLYERCLYTVYPSLYEGWGLPVAESLARGKVVLCSNSSSIPEAGGSLAEYFSPYDAVALADLIKKYNNREMIANKEKAITTNYKITTWESSYNKFISLIK